MDFLFVPMWGDNQFVLLGTTIYVSEYQLVKCVIICVWSPIFYLDRPLTSNYLRV
jgi:hypothetical protein